MKTALVLLNRNLRLKDNRCLNEALRQADRVLIGFHLNPEQLSPGPYFCEKRQGVFLRILTALQNTLRTKKSDLLLEKGPLLQVLQTWIKKFEIDAIFTPFDVTPFAKAREAELQSQLNIPIHFIQDLFLFHPKELLKADGSPYSVYTPFAKKAFTSLWPQVEPTPRLSKLLPLQSSAVADLFPIGAAPSQTLDTLIGQTKIPSESHYENFRDTPSVEGTSSLSIALRFGTRSPRQISSEISMDHPLQRQLLWRDFFSHIAYHHPKVFGNAFRDQYNHIPWQNRESNFEAWKMGRTGFPIVDAGMRELLHTGLMHNRLRMITASFLIKNLHVDWRWGERHFAQHLLDYDPALNNGNWQWCASTGCDAQPYFRIFNPWNQQEKWDPEAKYIKKWVPELAPYSPKEIHNLKKGPQKFYPPPLVDLKESSEWVKKAFKNAATSEVP